MKLRAVGLTESSFTFPSASANRAVQVFIDEDGLLSVRESRKTKETNADGDPIFEKVNVDLPEDVAKDLLADTSLGRFIIEVEDKPKAAPVKKS